MPFDSHQNFAAGTVATAPSPATSGTSLVLSADFNPAPTPPYNIVICPASTAPTPANAEIARVTADSSGTLTITRAQEGSSARTVVIGDQVFAAITVKTLTDIEGTTLDAWTAPAADVAMNSHKLTGLAAGTAAGHSVRYQQVIPVLGVGIYGDGSDGTVTFDGSTTILGMAPSSSVYTLTRDFFFAAVTINSGVQLKTNGFRIFCSGAITGVDGTSIIQWNGTTAASATAGAATNNTNSSFQNATGATTSPGAQGGGGGLTTGTAGNAQANNGGYGGVGGTGGTGTGGAGAAGGTVAALSAGRSSVRTLPFGIFLQSFLGATGVSATGGGAGGGGGGGDTSNAGGGGGGGGAMLGVYAKTFAGTGAIQARGGAGFTPTAGNAGGGGGGGGGLVVVVSQSVAAGAISGWAVDANGGAAGSPHGTGTNNATAGANGTAILLPN